MLQMKSIISFRLRSKIKFIYFQSYHYLKPFHLTKNHEGTDVFKNAKNNEEDENQIGDDEMEQ